MESNSLQIERLEEIEEEQKKLEKEQILIKEEILGAGKNKLVNKIAYHNT